MQLKRLLSLILSGILLIGVVGCGTTSTESTVDDELTAVKNIEDMTDQEFIDSFEKQLGIKFGTPKCSKYAVLYTIKSFDDGDTADVEITIDEYNKSDCRMFGLILPDDWKDEHYSDGTDLITKFLLTVEPSLSEEQLSNVIKTIFNSDGGGNYASYYASYKYDPPSLFAIAGDSGLSDMLNSKDDEIYQSDSDIETDNDNMYSTNECDTSPISISSSSDTPITFYNQYGVEVTLTNVEFTEREVDGEIFTNIEVQFLCTNNNIYKEDVAINFQNFSVDGNALKVNSSLLSFDDERDFNREIYYERKNSKETLYFPFYENFSDKDFNSITGTISLIDESGNTLVSRDIVIGNDGIIGLHLFEKYGVHYIQ